MSDCLFVMTSAINTKHGVFHKSTRLRQTKETIGSINTHCPNSDIIVIDGGERDLDDFEKTAFFSDVLKFTNYSNDANVKSIQKTNNHDIVKNMIEIYMFVKMFEDDIALLKRYKRVFKISGRYQLNENFSRESHLSQSGKIIISGERQSQFDPKITGGATRQYMSRLWSFDSSLSEEIADTYKAMFEDMKTRLAEGGYIDIEHLLYKHLRKEIVVNFSPIGIEGSLAPIGVNVSD